MDERRMQFWVGMLFVGAVIVALGRGDAGAGAAELVRFPHLPACRFASTTPPA